MANRRYFGSIRRRESGRWQIRYRTRDGVRVAWPETYARRADAVRVLAELERQSQVAGNWLDVAGSKVLFAAYADEWINQHPRLGPRTADVYRSLIRRHIAPTLGQIPLGQLDTATVREWRAGLIDASATMVAKTRLTRCCPDLSAQQPGRRRGDRDSPGRPAERAEITAHSERLGACGGPNEPQLIAVELRRSRKTTPDQG